MDAKAEETLSASIESSRDLIWSVDLDFRLTAFNRALQESIQNSYGIAVAIGQSPFDFLPAEQAAHWVRLYWRALAEGSYQIEVALQDGRFLKSILNPIFDEKKAVGVSVFGRDTIKRLENRKPSREIDAGFRKFFEENGTVMLLVEPLTGKIVAANRAASSYYGYSQEQLREMHACEINAEPTDQCVEERLSSLSASTACFCYRHRLASGEIRDVELYSSPFHAEGGALLFAIIYDVTERRSTERRLRDSEERFRATFEQAAIGIVHTSLDGRFLRCNPRFAQIVGYSPEEVVGLTMQQITAPEDLVSSTTMLQRVAAESVGSACFEKRYRRKDGTLIWVRLTASLQRDGDGKILHNIAFVEEIDALKAAERALHLSEVRYSTAFQTSQEAIHISRLSDGRYLDVNQAFLDMLGFTREEVIGKTSTAIGILVHPENRPGMVETLLHNSGYRDSVARFRKKNGDLIWVLKSASLMELEGVPYYLGVMRDITESKTTQERLAEAQESLRASEERYRIAFHTIPDAICIARLRDGAYIDVNQKFLEMTGYTRGEIIGKTSLELNMWFEPMSRKKMVDRLSRKSTLKDFEARFRRKNGQVYWAMLSASIIRIDDVECALCITRDISDAKQAEAEIRSLAFYDPLTALPNRRLLMDRLQKVLSSRGRNRWMHALLFIDLDSFKTLNDTLGHSIGDLLLQETARCLSANVRETDTIARIGGDEFVVILENLSETATEAASQAKMIVEKILVAIAQPLVLEGHHYRSSASIGITIFGDQATSAEEVLQQSDIAMYRAKTSGRNTLHFFSTALQTAILARARMEMDLRQAIQQGQFLLYYQPQIDHDSVTGSEALLRWLHPKHGVLVPGEFIALAEETGLILPMGEWVLETACRQIAAWSERPETSHLSLAVNISARQLHQADFVEKVLSILERTGASAHQLKLELTESMLLEDTEEMIGKMAELKAHGLGFSLDDFGTGYSSLSYLKRLPLEQLKIDRSFVRDILFEASSAAIAQAIIGLGIAMALPVIAEGVESEEQRQLIGGFGCHSYQGYLLSEPLPLQDFETLICAMESQGSSHQRVH